MITEEQQNLIWHTKTLNAYTTERTEKVIDAEHVTGTETYITINKKHLEGYEIQKIQKGKKIATVYFIRTEDYNLLPIEITKTMKIHDKGKVFNLITAHNPKRYYPKKTLNWKQIIDYSGIPKHTNQTQYTIYKLKRLYGRTKGQFYGRYITKSSFGKDKYTESYRLLLGKTCNLSDPTVANLFYRANFNKDITINELPDDSDRKEFNKMQNLFMRIGDKTTKLDNRSRGFQGAKETAEIDELSVSFTHNIPQYYLDRGRKPFFQIYGQNVINRYYPSLYEGFLQAQFPDVMNHKQIAKNHEPFLKIWIDSVLWYEENWHKLPNKYPNADLSKFPFAEDETRFEDHFTDFARCLSHYAQTEEEYLEMLSIDYNCHKNYVQLVRVLEGEMPMKVTTEKLE